MLLFLPFPKCDLLGLLILPKILRILFRIQFIKLNQNCRNLNKILPISGNFKSTKKADHILKIPEHWVFSYN